MTTVTGGFTSTAPLSPTSQGTIVAEETRSLPGIGRKRGLSPVAKELAYILSVILFAVIGGLVCVEHDTLAVAIDLVAFAVLAHYLTWRSSS